MRRSIRQCLSTVAVVTLAFPTGVRATTWADVEVTCPVCGEKNSFKEVRSYGSYIYAWPSKFQYVFWPLTHDNSVYSCRKCRLTCLMWDFRAVPAGKHDAVRKALEGVEFEGDHDKYTDIPVVARLEAAEKVYEVIGQDDEDRCRFLRLMGYHREEAGDLSGASAARRKALDLARRMLERKDAAGVRKELLVISGAMKHHLGDEAGALADFREAGKLRFENSAIEKRKDEGLDRYLGELLEEYARMVEEGAKALEKPGLHRAVFEALKAGDPEALESVTTAHEDIVTIERLSDAVAGRPVYPSVVRSEASWKAARDLQRTVGRSFAKTRDEATNAGLDWAAARLAAATVHGLAWPYDPEHPEPVLDIVLTVKSGETIVRIRLDACPRIGGKRKLSRALVLLK
ncbi:MAG: hypothetical protein ACYTKD_11815 [Planctomycetota bacterium]|jgi:hypothetical protein